MHVFEWRSSIPVSAAELFAWHARLGGFERVVPSWQRVRVLERPPRLTDGARLVFEYRAGPARGRWVAEYAGVIAGRQFVDRQAHGPFASWEHTHRFVPVDATHSELIDHLEYSLPAEVVTGLLGAGRTTRGLERVFRFRHVRTHADLERHWLWRAQPRLKIAVSGAGGFIGGSLATYLAGAGHEVVRLVRRPAAGPDEIAWDPAAGRLDPAALTGVDAVVNLAGVSIASVWTAARRRAILESRLQATSTLVTAILRMPEPPRVLVSASAVGAYGSRTGADIGEESDLGAGFLADVCRAWEAAAAPVGEAGVRVVTPRFGLVISAAGGALATMLPAFKAGLGVRFGDGRQWWSWVQLDDLLAALEWLIHDEELRGAVNLTAPQPVTNADFTKTVGRVLGRPAVLSAPRAIVVRGLRGMGEEMFLASQRVLPTRLTERGFRFGYPQLEPALRFELGRQ